MGTTLGEAFTNGLEARFEALDTRLAARFPGDSGARQPVHTLYGGAHLFRPNAAAKLGALGRRALAEHAPSATAFADALGLGPDYAHAATLYARVVAKLDGEAVEDLRVDFEDGYGVRSDAEEDAAALAVGDALAQGMAEGTLPPFVGVRTKALARETRARSLRTLDLVVTALTRSAKALPAGFVVTLPKVVDAEQLAVLHDVLSALEDGAGLSQGSIRVEAMVEATACIVDARGELTLPKLVSASGGRLRGAHFGSYDYTASCGVTANEQRMTHPSCNFARHMMQVAFAGTGVTLSDGATNVLPVGTSTRVVHDAWRLHYANIRDSLMRGFFQGWDLHPAQLPVRFAATYAFFLEGAEAAARRLRGFVDKAAQATLAGAVFDDAATGQGLLNFFLRALGCGAVVEGDVVAMTGLSREALETRSFAQIVALRQG